MFNPAIHQPNNIFFDLKMGGLERIYEMPNIPLEFAATFSNTQIDFVTFTLFDEAGAEVEPYIWESRASDGTAGGTFKWGYTQPDGIESPEYDFFIQNYKPRFVDNAFSLTIYAYIGNMSLLSSSNQYSGTLEEILNDMAKVHELTLKIEPSFDKAKMRDCGMVDRNSTKKIERKFNKFQWESDWRFINRLLYYAVDQEGKVGYKAVVTTKDGEPTLLITRGKNSSADYTYEVQAKDSVVIDWSPDITFTAIFDQNDVHFNGTDPGTGDPTKQAMNLENTGEKMEDFGQTEFQNVQSKPVKGKPDKNYYRCPETMPDNVTKGAIRSRPAASRTPWGGSIPAFYSHISNAMELNTASLVVCGDPRLKAYSDNNGIALVDVDFRQPINYFNKNSRAKHYTSGIWQVTDVIHRITLGNYQTEFQMLRPGNADAPQKGDSGG